jgi:hypothetical protein
MTEDEREYQGHNLTFFRDMVLTPGLSSYEASWGLPQPSLVPQSLALIEAALWLKLGVGLDFFDGEMAADTLASIERQLSTAWIVIMNNKIERSTEWCNFMSDEKQPIFIKDKFLSKRDSVYPKSAEHLEHLSQCFLGCLLLTSEVLFDRQAMFCLEQLGWTTDEALNVLLSGYPMFLRFSLADLYIGFEKHIKYFSQLRTHLQAYFFFMTERGDLENGEMKERVETIVMQRRLLDREPAKTRSLRLGAHIAAMVYRQVPEWYEARNTILNHIADVAQISRNDMAKYWPHPAGPSENFGRNAGQIPLWFDDTSLA